MCVALLFVLFAAAAAIPVDVWPRNKTYAEVLLRRNSPDLDVRLATLDAAVTLWPFGPAIAATAHTQRAEIFRAFTGQKNNNLYNLRALEACVLALIVNPYEQKAREILNLALSSVYYGAPPQHPFKMLRPWQGNVRGKLTCR
jgi:hypothetical protein